MGGKAKSLPSKAFSSSALTSTNETLLKTKKEKEDPKEFDKQIQEKLVFYRPNRLSYDESNVFTKFRAFPGVTTISSEIIHSSSVDFKTAGV